MAKKDVVTVDPSLVPPVETVETPGDAPVAAPVPLPVPPGGWSADEFTGEAGSFVRDPFTGVRSRAAE